MVYRYSCECTLPIVYTLQNIYIVLYVLCVCYVYRVMCESHFLLVSKLPYYYKFT